MSSAYQIGPTLRVRIYFRLDDKAKTCFAPVYILYYFWEILYYFWKIQYYFWEILYYFWEIVYYFWEIIFWS